MIIMTISAVDGWTDDDTKLIEHVLVNKVHFVSLFHFQSSFPVKTACLEIVPACPATISMPLVKLIPGFENFSMSLVKLIPVFENIVCPL